MSDARTVELIAKCARAISLGYLESKKEPNQQTGWREPGANLSLLQNSLGSDWDDFRKLAAPHRFLKISDSVNLVQTHLERMATGRYRNQRPTAFALVQLLVDGVSPTLLQDWYRLSLRREYEIVDDQSFQDFSRNWLDRFNEIQPGAAVGRDHLLKLVPSESHETAGRDRRWILGLIETLEFLAILRPHPKQDYLVNMHADSPFVLANALGVSTGNEGLDYLFFGALRVPQPELVSVLLSGGPGLGKTTLALGVAAQVAARGGFCRYVRFEVPSEVVARQLRSFYQDTSRHFDTFQTTPESPWIPRAKPARGGVEFSHATTGSLRELQEATVRAALDAKSWFPERLIVIDSINALPGYAESGPRFNRSSEWREALYQTTAMLRASGASVLYIAESEDDLADSFEAFLADIYIRLHLQRSNPTYEHRAVRIAKSRMQLIHRGDHRYSITSGEGLQIHPSSLAVASSLRNRAHRYYAFRDPITVSIPGMGKYLSRTEKPVTWNPAGQRRQAETVSFLRTGSVTLLKGPRGTLKSRFARRICQQQDSSILTLQFSDQDRPDLTSIPRKDRRRFGHGFHFERRLGAEGDDKRAPTENFIWFRSSASLSGEQVLAIVRETVRRQHRNQTPIKRASLSDLTALASNFPALHRDLSFVPTLIELLASEGITTVVVFSRTTMDTLSSLRTPETGPPDLLYEQVQSLCENVIEFLPIKIGSSEHVAIRVECSADNSHDPGLFELEYEALHDRLSVIPTFDLIKIEDGKAKQAPVEILIHHETDLQKIYHKQRERIPGVMKALAPKFRFKDHRTAAFGRALADYSIGHAGLLIVQIDNRQLPLMSRRAGQHSLLEDLAKFEEVQKLAQRLVPIRARGEHGIPAVNYYLNPPLLAVTETFWQACLAKWPAIQLGQAAYSWADLIETARELGSSTQPILSSDGGEDDDVCLFLEILASLYKGDLNRVDFRNLFSVRLGAQVGHALIEEAMETLVVLRKGVLHPTPSTPAAIDTCAMKRTWYSFYRAAQENRRLMKLPGQVWTCGDWGLGIVSGSLGVRTGVQLILDRFVNFPAAIDLYTHGVGLPPFKDLYGDQPLSELAFEGNSDVGLAWFRPYASGEGVIYRSMLRDYSDLSPTIAFALRELIVSPNPEGSIRAKIALLDRIFQLGSVTTKRK